MKKQEETVNPYSIYALIVIGVTILIFGCANSKPKTTKIDKEFNEALREVHKADSIYNYKR